MRSQVTAELSEELGVHTAAAKAMRLEYQKDLQAVSDEHAVIVMDLSQNLTLSSVTSTPSQWFFLSLNNVNVFGIYYANTGIQYNYVYDESVAGKGSDEVNSMLYSFIHRIVLGNGHRNLTIYADNCGGNIPSLVAILKFWARNTALMSMYKRKWGVQPFPENEVTVQRANNLRLYLKDGERTPFGALQDVMRIGTTIAMASEQKGMPDLA